MADLTKKQKKEVRKEVDKEVEKVEQRLHRQLISKASHSVSVFGYEFRTQTAAAIIAAFGFLIALVWKDLIVLIVEQLALAQVFVKYPYLAQFVSTIIVTAVCVIGIIIISRWAKK